MRKEKLGSNYTLAMRLARTAFVSAVVVRLAERLVICWSDKTDLSASVLSNEAVLAEAVVALAGWIGFGVATDDVVKDVDADDFSGFPQLPCDCDVCR